MHNGAIFCEFHERREPFLSFQISFLFLYGTTIEQIFAYRFFFGIVDGGAQICVLLYLAGISNANIRGKLCTTFTISRNIGLLLAYVVGNVWHGKEATIFIGISILFAISYVGIPSTPQYLLRTGNVDVSAAITHQHVSIHFQFSQLILSIFMLNRKRRMH